MLVYLRALKNKHQHILHSDNFVALVEEIRKDLRVIELFDQRYFSNEIGMLKIGEAAFRHVLAAIRKKSEECVFVEDKEKNLVAPRKMGIQVVLFRNLEKLKQDFTKLGICKKEI